MAYGLCNRSYTGGPIAFIKSGVLNTMDLTEIDIDRLCLKLRFKIVYHLGQNCVDVDDVVQESLSRFFRVGQLQMIRDSEELGAYLNVVCRNVILEYRQKMGHMESASRPFRSSSVTV